MKNDGKKLEKELSKALKEYCQGNHAYIHRFYDTRSASGNFLPAQPGDFLLLVPNFALLIECKSTQTGETLLSLAKKNKAQLAKHKLWLRSGHPAVYLHLDERCDVLEWHDSSRVLAGENSPVLFGRLTDIGFSLKTFRSRFLGQ